MRSSPNNLLTVLGPTASGKTRLAACLAGRLNGEIISADSRQVYRGMNIGTGKDYNDYLVDGQSIPYHLIDIVDPGYEYSVFEYQHDFVKVFREITERNRLPVVCGGSGLYLEAVLLEYKLIRVPVNPELRHDLNNKSMDELAVLLRSFKKLHNKTDSENRKRLTRALEIEYYYRDHSEIKTDYPDLKSLLIGVKFDRDSRRKRITERLKSRLKQGMIEEVETLVGSGITYEQLAYYGLEYKYVALYLRGELKYDEMVDKLNIAIHQFAKRQMTWFRRMERNGMQIHWLDGYMPMEDKINVSINLFNA